MTWLQGAHVVVRRERADGSPYLECTCGWTVDVQHAEHLAEQKWQAARFAHLEANKPR